MTPAAIAQNETVANSPLPVTMYSTSKMTAALSNPSGNTINIG